MIEVCDISKRFGKKVAVDHLSFTAKDGEVLGFLGPNGAGKSTTMNIITGYLSATEGTAKIDGIDILENPIEAKKHIGFLPEIPPLYPDMTVQEYLGFVYDLKGCTLPKEQHLTEVCGVVRIMDVYKRRIRNLSKGYRQRVGMAQALINNPKVLIFDEPTIGLDPGQIVDIRKLIRKLGEDHTVILSSHILPEVQAVCDRIVVINKGKLVADERTEDLINAVDGARGLEVRIVGPQDEVVKGLNALPGVKGVEVIGRRDTDSISYKLSVEQRVDIRKPINTLCSRNGWYVYAIESMELSFENIFLALVGDKEKENAADKKTKRRINR